MTGIGYEIDPHLLGSSGFASIDEADQCRTAGDGCDAHQPVAARIAESGQLDTVAVVWPVERLESRRMTDDLIERSAGEGLAEQGSSSSICRHHAPFGGDQCCFGETFDDRPAVGKIGHR